MTIILLIIGSRTFVDYDHAKREILRRWRTIDRIYVGGKKDAKGETFAQDGACLQGWKFAQEFHIPCDVFAPLRWGMSTTGRPYPVRDPRFLEVPTDAIAFWDGTSPGTRGELSALKRLGKTCEVIYSLKIG
jgi:hypothetical protein